MTREEAIKRFENQLKAAIVVLDSGFGTRPGENDRIYRERKEMAQLAIAALREQEERRWIPVTERLPEVGKNVLVYSEMYGVCVDCYDLGTFGCCYVTHWMPLPEPPKEDAQ